MYIKRKNIIWKTTELDRSFNFLLTASDILTLVIIILFSLSLSVLLYILSLKTQKVYFFNNFFKT